MSEAAAESISHAARSAGPLDHFASLGRQRRSVILAPMGLLRWSVREGTVGEFDAPEIMSDFRSVDGEPRLGDLLFLPDGSGPWRVVDARRSGAAAARVNVLVVELFGD